MTQLPYYIFLGLVHNIYYCEIATFDDNICSYDKLKEKHAILNQCLDQKAGLYEFSKSIYRPSGKIVEFVNKRCDYKPQLDNCMDVWVDLVKECLDPADLKGVKVWQKIDSEIADYVCKNAQELVPEIFQKGRSSCRDGGLPRILNECSRQLTITAQFYEIDKVKQSCSQIEEMERCVINKLTQRCSRKVVELATPLFHTVKTNLCN